MSLDKFRTSLRSIFESSNYEAAFKEEEVQKQEFLYTHSDGSTFKVEVEAHEGEFYVFNKDGQQVDLFNMALVDQDGGVPKDVRAGIANEWKMKQSSKEVSENAEKSFAMANAGFKPKAGEDKKTAITQRIAAVKPDPNAETKRIVKANEECTDCQPKPVLEEDEKAKA